MFKNLILILLSLLSFSLWAQQESIYTNYWNNPSTYNPATTGEQSKFYSAVNFRNQWIEVKGHPINVNALFEIRVDTINSAFGINYSYLQLGIEKSNKINFNYSYHIKLAKDRKIGFGDTYEIVMAIILN